MHISGVYPINIVGWQLRLGILNANQHGHRKDGESDLPQDGAGRKAQVPRRLFR